jgi:hypothetical protein
LTLTSLSCYNVYMMRTEKEKIMTNLSVKVSAKGAVSVYGLQRFPVTLYASQWEALLDKADGIRDFIAANTDSLAVKTAAVAKVAEDRVSI